MEYIITEQQLRLILNEEEFSSLTRYLGEMKSFTSNLISRVRKKYGLNLKMLLTWGSAVGGFVMPLDQFIKTGNFNLTEDQLLLVLSGVASFVFFENKKLFRSIYRKIKEENIESEFNEVLSKSVELKDAFFNFILSLNTTISNVSELVGYSFLIPIITDIQSGLSGGDLTEMSINIVKRLVASGSIIASSEVLTTLIKKIIERIR